MKRPVVMDTDISSLAIKGQLSLAWSAKLVWTRPYMTFVTEGELLRWTRLRNLGRQRRGDVFSWITNAVFVPGDKAAAKAYAELSASARRHGRVGPGNDTWIAACCVARRLPLATLNLKDFHYFAEHHGLELITA
jgi:predicted nucleic acid-binding protein